MNIAYRLNFAVLFFQAWGSLTSQKSQTRDPPAWSPSRRTSAQDFYVLKKKIHRPQSGLNLWTLDLETAEADFTYIYSLLIEKGICDCWNSSSFRVFVCTFVWRSLPFLTSFPFFAHLLSYTEIRRVLKDTKKQCGIKNKRREAKTRLKEYLY